jgi:hypothetical protein
MGIKVYLDEANHVGIDNQPFYYAGMLNIFKMRSNVVRMELFGENNLEIGKAKFLAAYEKLKAKGGGTISIYYHPCEWVHQEFWDGVNFSRGANPAKKDWKLPKMRSREETEKAFQDFEEYVKFIKGQDGVRYVTANELAEKYEDRSMNIVFNETDLGWLSQFVQKEITFHQPGSISFSAADLFYLLTEATSQYLETGKFQAIRLLPMGGPNRSFESKIAVTKPSKVKWEIFSAIVHDTNNYCRTNMRIPSEIRIGSDSISPQDFLATLGGFVDIILKKESKPEYLEIKKGNFTADKYVADDDPKIFNWVIHPEGFHAPKIMELAKLQAWTLKPAVMKK